MGKVLWSRRRKKEKKPNKRVSPNLSYQRHHLIRISSCNKTTSKKKTKKTNSPQKIHPIKVQLQHAFNSFGKWCSFPQEFEAREKITQDKNYLQLTQRKEAYETKNIANFYVTRNIILQSASCFQHFCFKKKILFPKRKKKKKKKKKK